LADGSSRTPRTLTTCRFTARPSSLRRRCTAAKRGRTIQLHPHEDELCAARRRAVTRSFQQRYRRWRPMVERSLAWLAADDCRRVGALPGHRPQ
jgi:hypothetical protein